jgi:hypothetical protein
MSYLDADSKPHPQYEPSDNTTKVLPLGQFAVGGYSGAPRSALNALGFVADNIFYRRPLPSWTADLLDEVKDELRFGAHGAAISASTQEERASCGRFEVLIGFFDDKGRPHLLHFDSHKDVIQITEPGPKLIGSGATYNSEFLKGWRNAQLRMGSGSRPLRGYWATQLADGLAEAFIDNEPDEFVGGGIQLSTVDLEGGYVEYQLIRYRPKDESKVNPYGPFMPEQMEWRRLTPENLTPYPTPRRKGSPAK